MYDEHLPENQRERFSSYYYKYVALGEGCGCAEQVLARRSHHGFFSGILGAALQRWRQSRRRTGE